MTEWRILCKSIVFDRLVPNCVHVLFGIPDGRKIIRIEATGNRQYIIILKAKCMAEAYGIKNIRPISTIQRRFG